MKRPADQERWGRRLRRWPKAELEAQTIEAQLPPFEVWRSRDWFVQLFHDDGHVRITVNRTHQPNGIDWADGITWDELQAIKSEIGRGDAWAVELFPADGAVVNVSNMRHLWLLDEPPTYGWNTGHMVTP